MNMIVETNEMIDPKDEIVFHVEKLSLQSEYRRGIPFSPKKCWGKNVIFTPVNIEINCTFAVFGLMVKLNRSGAQWVIPAMMANTAPIDST